MIWRRRLAFPDCKFCSKWRVRRPHKRRVCRVCGAIGCTSCMYSILLDLCSDCYPITARCSLRREDANDD